MSIIDTIKERAKKAHKKIVLPEAEDIRILIAAAETKKEGFAEPILVGEENKIHETAKKKKIALDGIKIIEPKRFHLLEKMIEDFYELRKEKGITKEKARKIISNNPIYFATMLVKEGWADGLVCGSICTSAETLRPALQIIKSKEKKIVASSFFLMELADQSLGENGCFVYSDCGLIQNPTSEELTQIALSSANTFKLLLEKEPIIAFLSHSTKDSSTCQEQEKVKKAVSLAKQKYPQLTLDGEMQFDTAIIEEVAKIKDPNSKVAGHANTLIFPNLDAGNIGYKITERLAHAQAYGPITQGLRKPINDLSRGCKPEDIIGVIAITALQASEE